MVLTARTILPIQARRKSALPEGERKYVTAMFPDISGSLAMTRD